MGLIKHKVYDLSYKGWASEATVEFHTIRSDLIQNIASWIATTAVEAQTWANDGELIELWIYSEESTWGIFNTFKIKIMWRFYNKSVTLGQAVPVAWPAIILAAVVVIIGIIALVFLVDKVTDIFIEAKPYLPWILVAVIGVPVIIFLTGLLIPKEEKT